MAKDIKIRQRNAVKDVKQLDRAALVMDKMKKVATRAKDEAESAAWGGGDSQIAYAERKVENGAKDTFHAAANLVPRYKKRESVKLPTASIDAGRDRAVKQKAQTAWQNAQAVRQKVQTVKQERRTVKTAFHGGQHYKIKTVGAKTQYARMNRQTARTNAAKTLAVKKAQRKAAAKGAKATAAAFMRMVRGTIAALRALVTAIATGGIVAVIVIILIVIIAAILGSALGIFFSNEADEGLSMGEAIATLTDEFADKVEQIISDNPHDELEMAYTSGNAAIDWKSVVAIYAVRTAESPDNPAPVITLGEENMERLRTVFNDMNAVSYYTRTETRTRTVIAVDPDTGETTQTTDTITVTVLKITITQKSATEMATQYHFTKSQKETLAEILSPDYDKLWEELLGAGAYRNANGEHRQPSPDRTPTGIFAWPLEQAGTITSWFGWRKDPITGETTYHEGVDIGVPNGTPILAAADGTVTVANATDSYAGGWGYYVKIQHGSGFDTLYAHCSAIAVRTGEKVTKGQIIAYVGSTGRSTGEHLHWEVYLNGTRVDPLNYFK